MAVSPTSKKQDIFSLITDDEIGNIIDEKKDDAKDIFSSILDEEINTQPEQEPESFLDAVGDVIGGAAKDTVRPIVRTGRNLAKGVVGTAGELANVLVTNPVANVLGLENVAENTKAGAAMGAVEEGFDFLTGGIGKPQSETEEIQDTAGEFLASTLVGGPVPKAIAKIASVAPKASQLATNTFQRALGVRSIPEAVGVASAGAAAEKLKQEDASGMAQILGTLGAGIAGGGISNIAGKSLKRIGSSFDMTRDLFKLDASTAEKLIGLESEELLNLVSTPKTERFKRFKDLKKSSKEFDVDLPLSVYVNKNLITSLESYLSGTSLAGQHYTKATAKLKDSFISGYEKILDKVSKTQYEGAFNAGEKGLETLKKNRDLATDQYSALYDRSKASIPEGTTTLIKNTENGFKQVLKDIGNPLLKSSETNTILEKVNPIIERFNLNSEISNKANSFSVSDLIKTKLELHSIIDFETLSKGNKGLLKKALAGVNKDIEKYGQTNEVFRENYKRANELFGDSANRFRSSTVRSLIKNEIPEDVLKKMNSVSGMRDIGAALSPTKQGEKIFRSLKRHKLQTILVDKFFDKATGEFSPRRFSSTVSESQKNSRLIKELMGEKQHSKILKLGNLATEITKSAVKFANPSGSAKVHADMVGVTTFLGGLFSGNIPIALLPIAPRAAARLLTDERFVNLAAKSLNSVKRGNVKSFNKSRNAMLAIIKEEQEKEEK